MQLELSRWMVQSSLSTKLPSDADGIVLIWWGLSSSNSGLAFPACLSQPVSNNLCHMGYVFFTFNISGTECGVLIKKKKRKKAWERP